MSRSPASKSPPPPSVLPRVLLLGSTELAACFAEAGFEPRSHLSLEPLLETEEHEAVRAVVVSVETPGLRDVARAVQGLRRRRPLTDVLVWNPKQDAAQVRDCLRAGARDVVLSRDPQVLIERTRQVVEDQVFLPRVQRLERARRAHSFEGMASRSPSMWDLFDLCVRIAPTEANVLIRGETGTGKELLARAIHRQSERRGRFVAVNCAALPEGLVDAELFGHERGTFTGASRSKKGLFRHAEGGTLFLDEIGNVPPAVQFSLLRALQEGTVRPVGSHDEVPVDVRVLAATSEPLEAAVERGDFREDLLYRLDVIRLVLPPLRERQGDLAFLFHRFVRKFSRSYGLEAPAVREDFLDALGSHPWPGNVRQLENFCERLVLTHPKRVLRAQDFLDGIEPRSAPSRSLEPLPETPEVGPESDPCELDLEATWEENLARIVGPLEKSYYQGLLARYRGRVGLVAEHAGVHRRTIARKLRALGLDKQEYRSET